MRWLGQLYRTINILSIDVAAGAIMCALFFGKLFKVDILPYGIAALGLTVWIIYTVDHLRDARKISGPASSDRHRFHQQHFRMLIACVVVASVIDAVLIFFIRKPVFIGGIFLTVFVALYLVVQARLRFMKETFVALLYTIGILLPSIAVTTVDYFQLAYVGLILQFFLIAELNLLLFSLFDYEQDTTDGLASFATQFGKPITSIRIAVEFGSFFAISIFHLFYAGFSAFNLIVLLSGVTLLVLFLFKSLFHQHALYRFIGDAVFFYPALIFLYA